MCMCLCDKEINNLYEMLETNALIYKKFNCVKVLRNVVLNVLILH